MHFRNLDTFSLLVGLAVLILVVLAVGYGRSRRQRLLARLLAPPLDQRLISTLHSGRRWFRTVLLGTGLFLVLVALARPWWGTHLIPAPRHSRDLLFVVDCSRSMLAKDVAPSRLDHAKWWIREVTNRCPGDRFGLIAFAGDAFLECPLTQDLNTIYQFLDALDTKTIAVGGTNIAAALRAARKAFKAAEGSHQAIILLSDGEELEGDSRAEIQYFKDTQVPLFVVGIGNPDSPAMVQLEDNSFLRDNSGKMVASKLNETGLKLLSDSTGGIYVRSTVLNANVDPVFTRIRGLVPAEQSAGNQKRPIERFQAPLLLGLLLLLLRLFIGERRHLPVKPVATATALVVAVLFFVNLPLHAEMDAADAAPTAPEANAVTGNRPPLLRDKNVLHQAAQGLPPEVAAQAQAAPQPAEARNLQLQRDLRKTKDELATASPEHLARLHFNLGFLHHQLGEDDQAVTEFETAIAKAGNQQQIKGLAYLNLGVAKHTLARQKLVSDPDAAINDLKALENLYREAMRLIPDHADPPRNQELLLKDIKVAEQIRDLMKKIRDLIQKAQKETQAAHQQQTAVQEEKDPAKRATGQDAADGQTEKAKSAVDALVQAAKQNLKPEAAGQFEQALNEIAAARKEQDNSRLPVRTEQGRADAVREAVTHLENALKLLGVQPPQQQQQGQQEQKPDQQKGQQQQGQQQQQQQASQDPQKNAEQQAKEALARQQEANTQEKEEERQAKQQTASEKTEQAEKAVEQAQQAMAKAPEPNPDKQQQLSQAKDEIRQAREEQKKAEDSTLPQAMQQEAGKEAEKNLEKAVTLLGGEGQEKNGEKDKEIDPVQARALLQQMQQQEQDFREAVKKQQRANRLQEVDKDW